MTAPELGALLSSSLDSSLALCDMERRLKIKTLAG